MRPEPRPPLSLLDEAEAVLSQIERLEVHKARLEGRIVDAYAALHSVEEQHLSQLVTSSPVPITAHQVVTQEVACATGVGAAEVARRLELATAPRRHRVLRERLRAGSVSLHRALRIVVETRMLADDALPDLEATVLAPARDGSISSHRLFGERLRRCVRAADPRGHEERRQAATARRTVFGRLVEDGMGTFTVVAPAERVVGVLDRVDAMARAARAARDARTLDQLRSDLLCDLVLFGAVAEPEGDRSAGSAGSASWSGLSDAPPAAVRIVVPFEVAAGLSDAPCELTGHGWVTAAHARQIMTAPGSVWQRLAADVDTGRALELSTERYLPTPEMVAHVKAVDGVCRGPGCQVPADRCDVDHLQPWPTGRTHVSNLDSLSRGCHNGKTSRVWNVRRVADEGISWTSLAGREYITYPKDWRGPLRGPGSGPTRDVSPGSPPGDPPPF
ncbi:HNH endonuclease signature motif containing protein [Terrabacter carboxydivorans]|uniref:HNH endonuclease signature motif containing protein n=1 Tax=Terrabacter carboxydivorans TaxID=619730 RepID=UPI0031D0E8A3